VPRGSAVEQQLREDPPAVLDQFGVLVQTGVTDAHGVLEPPTGGETVLSVPSPEELARQAEDVHRVLREAGTGTEPLVVVIQAAEALLQEELAPLIEAAARGSRPVIVRVIRPSET
jgi:hypothetical protein